MLFRSCFPVDVTQTVSPFATFSSGPGHVQFRWTVDTGSGDEQIGQRTMLSGRPSPGGSGTQKVQMPFGTFCSPFRRYDKSQTVTFKLQANKVVGSEWKGLDGSTALTTSDPLAFVRQGKLTEVIEEF